MRLVVAEDQDAIDRNFDEKTLSQLAILSDSGPLAAQAKYKRYSTSTIASSSASPVAYRPSSQLFDSYGNSPITPSTLASHGKSLIRPYKFGMWLGPDANTGGSYSMQHVHDYTTLWTQNGDRGESPISLYSLPNWESRFPYLHKLSTEGQLRIPVIHIQSNIRTMASRPDNLVFWAPFEASICNETYFDHGFTVVTRFYTSGNRLQGIDEIEEPALIFADSTTGERRVKFSLNPNFWSMYFNNMINTLLEPLKAGEDRDQEVRRRELQNADYIRNLTMIQEVYAWRSSDLKRAISEDTINSPINSFAKQRAALFVWDFSKTEGEEAPYTWWRPVVLESDTYSYPSSSARHSLDVSRHIHNYTPSLGQWSNSSPVDSYAPQYHTTTPPLIYPQTPYDEGFPQSLPDLSMQSTVKYSLGQQDQATGKSGDVGDLSVDYFQNYDQSFPYTTVAEHPEILSQWPHSVLAGHEDLDGGISHIQ